MSTVFNTDRVSLGRLDPFYLSTTIVHNHQPTKNSSTTKHDLTEQLISKSSCHIFFKMSRLSRKARRVSAPNMADVNSASGGWAENNPNMVINRNDEEAEELNQPHPKSTSSPTDKLCAPVIFSSVAAGNDATNRNGTEQLRRTRASEALSHLTAEDR